MKTLIWNAQNYGTGETFGKTATAQAFAERFPQWANILTDPQFFRLHVVIGPESHVFRAWDTERECVVSHY